MSTGTLTQSQVSEFLRELTELSSKHKIEIGGCQCCGSPYLLSITYEGQYEVRTETFDCLDWVKKA